jgi:hypothetical protein
MGRSLIMKISNTKVAGLPDCDACDGRWQALYKRQYQHPNGERYWMNMCVFCARKNWDFEVKS